MGELVLFASAHKPSEGQEVNEQVGPPDLGVANVLFEFFQHEDFPFSGFPKDRTEGKVLTFAFSPRKGWTRDWKRRKATIASLPGLMATVREISWAGRRYKVNRVLTVGLVETNRTGRGLTGWLCIELAVEELEN
ncbi:MAG: hypothetical protein ABIJ23_00150 [Candidatus Magasanikbacteria bacterium]